MQKKIKNIICLTPVYNDWDSFSILIKNIEKQYHGEEQLFSIEIVAVNDGSLDKYDASNFTSKFPIEILELKLNVGHQRAIAVGLQYINDVKSDFDYVVVMDSDGEDKPEDLIHLISKCEDKKDEKIIFAQRMKRQESAFFKIGYFFYKFIFYCLTGQRINFGNYSCIPKNLLKRVVVQDNLWNHYSGSIIQSKTPFDKVLLDRGKRYSGVSKMNFNSLIIHGLSSFSVYFDFLSLRILRYSAYAISICFISVMYIGFQKVFTNNAIPGWASSLILIISGIILQLFSVTLIVLLMQLSSRKNIKAPNTSIYKDFVDSVSKINR